MIISCAPNEGMHGNVQFNVYTDGHVPPHYFPESGANQANTQISAEKTCHFVVFLYLSLT